MRMSSGTFGRLAIALVGLLIVLACLARRDAIADLANLSPNELEAIVGKVEEWSSPKWSREIVLRKTADRSENVAAWVREANDRWSVTVFTNISGSWRKFGWVLVEKNGEVTMQAP